ncbi:MAG: hypothetical protein AAGG38_08975 [Planctomycetota bacterium]
MTKPATLRYRRGRIALCCVAAGLLAGCVSPDPVDEDAGYRIERRSTPPEVAQAQAAERVAVRWVMRRSLVPLSRPLEQAWALADEGVLPPVSQAVWNANGLRVGVLSASSARAFGAALGETAESVDGQLVVADWPELLRRSPPLGAEFVADLTVPPGEERRVPLTGGRLQLLVESRALGNGTAELTLIPQHARPRASIVPRTAREKLLDGRVFDELAVTLTVSERQGVLVGLFLPLEERPPEPDPDNPPEDTPQGSSQNAPQALNVQETPGGSDRPASAEPSEPAEKPEPAETDREALPALTLGRGLLTTGVGPRHFQVLLLIRPTGLP